MKDWIKMLFHHHKWKIIRHGRVDYIDTGNIGHYYELQCEICGKIKCKNT